MITFSKVLHLKGNCAETQVLCREQYLSPGVSSIRRDENTDISAGQLRSDHTCIQKVA